MFEYSSEDLDTGIAEVDAIETKYSQDLLEYQFQLEDDTIFLLEDGGSLIKEDFSTTIEPIDNTDFSSLLTVEGILDFSESNPFGEIGG